MRPWSFFSIGLGSIAASTVMAIAAMHAAGYLVIAGNGPERPAVEQLARAFERANRGAVIDLQWDRRLKPAMLAQDGSADIAVGTEEISGLLATPIAWEGIAVVVNFANPIRELTVDDLRSIFSGKVRSWSELNGGSAKIEPLKRPDYQHVTAAFLNTLGLAGFASSAKPAHSDQQVLNMVSGRLGAIGYLSLSSAQDAVEYGTPVQILMVNGVEAARPTVSDGRYAFRRPVVFFTTPQPAPQTAAFVDFARSQEGQQILTKFYVPIAP